MRPPAPRRARLPGLFMNWPRLPRYVVPSPRRLASVQASFVCLRRKRGPAPTGRRLLRSHLHGPAPHRSGYSYLRPGAPLPKVGKWGPQALPHPRALRRGLKLRSGGDMRPSSDYSVEGPPWPPLTRTPSGRLILIWGVQVFSPGPGGLFKNFSGPFRAGPRAARPRCAPSLGRAGWHVLRFLARPSSSERAARAPRHLYDAGGTFSALGPRAGRKFPSPRLSLPDPGPVGPESFVRPGLVAMARDRRPCRRRSAGGRDEIFRKLCPLPAPRLSPGAAGPAPAGRRRETKLSKDITSLSPSRHAATPSRVRARPRDAGRQLRDDLADGHRQRAGRHPPQRRSSHRPRRQVTVLGGCPRMPR